MIHRPDPSWGTHIPMLVKLLDCTDGLVVELGLGISSTPLLHTLCAHQGRLLKSYDNDPVFVGMFRKYRTSIHEIDLVEDWDKLEIEPCSIVLVDHKPDIRRVEEVKRLTSAEYVVLHDSEPEHENLYNYKSAYPLFKHRYDYTRFSVHTTVLSNYHALDFLHNS